MCLEGGFTLNESKWKGKVQSSTVNPWKLNKSSPTVPPARHNVIIGVYIQYVKYKEYSHMARLCLFFEKNC